MKCYHDWQHEDDAEMEILVDVILFRVYCLNCSMKAKEVWSGRLIIDENGNEL